MDIQEIIVVAITIGCIGWLIWRSIRSVFETCHSGNPCAHCATGCALRDEMRKKQQDCKKKQEKLLRIVGD